MKRIVLKSETPSPMNIPNGCRFHTRCPVAKPECGEKEPVYREIRPGHYIYCNYPQKII